MQKRPPQRCEIFLSANGGRLGLRAMTFSHSGRFFSFTKQNHYFNFPVCNYAGYLIKHINYFIIISKIQIHLIIQNT